MPFNLLIATRRVDLRNGSGSRFDDDATLVKFDLSDAAQKAVSALVSTREAA